MPYLYWEGSEAPRLFHTVESSAEIRRLNKLGIAEGECRTVGRRRYLRLPDKPILAMDGRDSVLEPAPFRACFESDLKFL